MSKELEKIIKNLKISYHSGHGDKLYKDFYSTLLSKAKLYIRETGDFTANVIFDWGAGLSNAIEREAGDCLIKMIANPKLQENDRNTLLEVLENKNNEKYLEELKEYISRIAEKTIEKSFEEAKGDIHKEIKLKIFAYLIANRILILKFGKPNHVAGANVFHPKSGVFYFNGDIKVGFIGGSNETHGGYVTNVEYIHVYNNLNGQHPHIEDIETKFNLGWEGNAEGFKTVSLKKEFLKKIETYAPTLKKLKEDIKKYNSENKNKLGDLLSSEKIEKLKKITQSNKSNIDDLIEPKENYLDLTEPKWEFQKKAREIFIEKKWGILEMATGTGKTRTALSIATQLINENKIDKIIVQMKGTDLIKQWRGNINEWTFSKISRSVNLLESSAEKEQMDSFLLNFRNSEVDLLLLRQSKLPSLLDKLSSEDLSRTLIIHDEVHDLFAEKISEQVIGKQNKFGYKLGLSATIREPFNTNREKTLFQEIQGGGEDAIFTYTLVDAISDGVLVQSELIELSYRLYEDERDEIRKINAICASKIKEGVPTHEAEAQRNIDVSDVRKNARNKIEVFEQNINFLKSKLKRSFIFADETKYGDRILNILIPHLNVKTHFQDADRENLDNFSKNKIDCIINVQMLSQGIDIKDLNTIVLFATPTGRQFIQRLGRVLRKDKNNPNKKAIIIDFFDEENMRQKDETSSDYRRYLELKKITGTTYDHR